MPADIRNFFGGNADATSKKQQKAVQNGDNRGANSKRRSQHRIILDDSDDEGPAKAKEITPQQISAKMIGKESPGGEETTTTDYFASSGKTKASKAVARVRKIENEAGRSSSQTSKKIKTEASKNAALSPQAHSRQSGTKKQPVKSNSALQDDDDDAFMDGDVGAGDDIFAANIKSRRQRRDEYIKSESEEINIPPKPTKTVFRRKQNSDLDNEMKDVEKHDKLDFDKLNKSRDVSSTGKKRKSPNLSESEDSEEIISHGQAAEGKRGSHAPATKRRRAEKEDIPENSDIKAIFDSIPTVKAPSPPPRDPNKKFDWKAGNSGTPPAAGAKELPVGAENCLVGLTFVFTGLLETISREQGQELVKRYGGRVTGSPSSKTDYVVLGSDAGPSKLEKIKLMKIKTVNEDGLFHLIRCLPVNGGGGKAAEKSLGKMKAEEEKIKRDAAEMEKENEQLALEIEKAARNTAAARGFSSGSFVSKSSTTSQLWTTKYAPTKTNQICGNKGQVDKIQKWLERWPKSRSHNFQLPGPDGSGKFRAIIIHGPPGIGKTTAAHLAAKLEGYDVIESNASDTRSKKLVETGLNEVLNNNSLLGFFAGDGKEVSKQKKKIVLVMDEVDGMSAGDRGGVGALAKVCRKTEVPMILICNDRRIPKMKPFDHVAYDLPFKRPTVEQVRSRIATICAREGLKIPLQVMDALIEGSNKDIRQIINMLSTAKLDQTSMDFDQGKSMSKAWEKHIILKPWDLCHKLLGGGLFAPSSKTTLNEKIELYFNDHEFSYLMIQENYLSTRPMLATSQGLSPKQQRLKILELADQAAESISDGDLVDRMIHGSQQQWGLMPTHAVFSTVRPASFISGAMSGNTSFTQWLGNNSKFGKLGRYVKEIQSHMRLRTSGDRHEVRQQYLPVLWDRLVNRLQVEGRECVEEVIKFMDSYFLTRDDFDYIMELGLGPQNQANVNLASATKSSFTRLYNTRSHPMPFMKASNVVAPQKMPHVAPDLEEAIEEEDDGEALVDEPIDAVDEDGDITTDKYIKKAKVEKDDKSKKNGSKKSKKSKNDVVDGSGEEAKPKSNRGDKQKGETAKGKKKI